MTNMQRKNNIYLRFAPALALAAALAYFFISKPDVVSLSVQDSLNLCAKAVIPSLFPFMVLASFIVEFSIAKFFGKLIRPVTSALFNLPGEAGIVVLMGLIGGFPVGPKMTADLYKKKALTKEQAQALCLFTINAGPAFVIGTIGFSMLGNIKYGTLLYISMVFASLFTGIFVCMKLPKPDKNKSTDSGSSNEAISFGDALCNAVNSGTASILNICAFIVVFSSIISGISSLIQNIDILKYISAALEVTQGLRAISENTAISSTLLPIMAAMLSFCGLCVHAQVHNSLRTVELPYTKFILSRLACSALSFLFCRAAILVFPSEYSVFSNMSNQIAADMSLSIFTCISILLMSILLIFDLDIPSDLC